MKAEKLIKELEYTRKKYEGKHVNTFETNIVAMIDDCISTVKELMPLATIGAATEKAFEKGYGLQLNNMRGEAISGFGLSGLLTWYAEQEQEGTK